MKAGHSTCGSPSLEKKLIAEIQQEPFNSTPGDCTAEQPFPSSGGQSGNPQPELSPPTPLMNLATYCKPPGEAALDGVDCETIVSHMQDITTNINFF
jgi:hypothetical protein